ncbi:MAG TPA: type II toxin-antitoxin system VapC family toxin [Acidobacteriota bacterium]|jgi:predicted nucleic acid-binding protein
MYLVDTSYLIDLAREKIRGKAGATKLLEHLPESVILYVSTITLAQLAVGEHLANSQRARKRNSEFRQWVAAICEIVPFRSNHAEHFGEIAASLYQKGKKIPESDIQIAATAVAEELVLVTRNHRHFARVPNLDLETY